MNTTVIREWIKRLFGWGLPIISGVVTVAVSKHLGSDAGMAVGGAVATVGSVVATKAIPYLIPEQRKVDAANAMPVPAPKSLVLPGSTLRK